MRLKHGITWHLSPLNQDTYQLTRGQLSFRPYPSADRFHSLPSTDTDMGPQCPHGLAPTPTLLQVGAMAPESRSVSWEQVSNLCVTQALLKSQRTAKKQPELPPLLMLWSQMVFLSAASREEDREGDDR